MQKAVYWLERAKEVGYRKLAVKTLREAKNAIQVGLFIVLCANTLISPLCARVITRL